MKKHILTLTAVMLLGLSSCEKDNGTTKPVAPKSKESMLRDGHWEATFVTSEYLLNGNVVFSETDTIEGITVMFTADNKVITHEMGQAADTVEYNMVGQDSIHLDSMTLGMDIITDSRLKLRGSFSAPEPGMPGELIQIFEFIR